MSAAGDPCVPPTDSQQNKPDSTSISDQKGKKKSNKIIEYILRDLPNTSSTEEKLHLLCQKFHILYTENKESLARVKQLEGTIKVACNERDQLQNERNRLILQKDKLETLCREVQKHSKTVEGESVARTRAEEEKRRQVSDHFQTSIAGIQKQLSEYQTRNSTLHRENQELAEKLKRFIAQHEKQESHIEKLIETRNLEVKLAEAKLQKSQYQLEKESAAHRHEVAGLQQTARAMEERMNAHLEVEKKLREQVDFYKVKYQDFNKTMASNNRLFESAKTEMQKFAKRIRQSERDITEWRGKWELSQRSLLEVVDELKRKETELKAAEKKVGRLSGLCRALQTQLADVRTGYRPASGGDAIEMQEEAEKDPNVLHSGDEARDVPEEVENVDKTVNGNTDLEKKDSCSADCDHSTVPAEEEDEAVLVEDRPTAEVEKAEDTDEQGWVSVPPSDRQP